MKCICIKKEEGTRFQNWLFSISARLLRYFPAGRVAPEVEPAVERPENSCLSDKDLSRAYGQAGVLGLPVERTEDPEKDVHLSGRLCR